MKREPPDTEVTEATPDPKPWLRCDEQARITRTLDLQQTALDWTLHWYIRKAAAELLQSDKQYTSSGSLFYAMTNAAVADFYVMQQGFETDYLEWIASVDTVTNIRLKNLTTFAFLLARAEGMPELEPKVLMQVLPNLCTLIKLEHKFRQGLVAINYKAYSVFDEDKHRPLIGIVGKS